MSERKFVPLPILIIPNDTPFVKDIMRYFSNKKTGGKSPISSKNHKNLRKNEDKYELYRTLITSLYG